MRRAHSCCVRRVNSAHTGSPRSSSRASASASMWTGWRRSATGPGVFRPSPVTRSTTLFVRPDLPGGHRLAERAQGHAGSGLAKHTGRLREQRHALADVLLRDSVDEASGRASRSRRRGPHRLDCRSRASGRRSPAAPGARPPPPRRRMRPARTRRLGPRQAVATLHRRGQSSSRSVKAWFSLVRANPMRSARRRRQACASRAARRSRRRSSSSLRRSSSAGRR